MRENLHDLISAISWFEDLSEKTVTTLSRGARVQRFPAGIILFSKGDVPDFCYVALEGRIELFVTDDEGDDVLVDMSGAPSAYTMPAVLMGVPYIVSGKTSSRSKLLMIDAKALRQSAREDPKLALSLIGLVCWQFRAMVRQVVNLKSKSTSESLGCYLLALTNGSCGARKLDLPLDGKHLAAQLGMTTMSLSRAFKILASHGVTKRGPNVSIANPDRLRAYCRPDDLIHEHERELKFPAD